MSVCSSVPDVSDPEQILTVTVLESPVSFPAAPAKAGVVSVVTSPSAGVVSVTAGGLVSEGSLIPSVAAETDPVSLAPQS